MSRQDGTVFHSQCASQLRDSGRKRKRSVNDELDETEEHSSLRRIPMGLDTETRYRPMRYKNATRGQIKEDITCLEATISKLKKSRKWYQHPYESEKLQGAKQQLERIRTELKSRDQEEGVVRKLGYVSKIFDYKDLEECNEGIRYLESTIDALREDGEHYQPKRKPEEGEHRKSVHLEVAQTYWTELHICKQVLENGFVPREPEVTWLLTKSLAPDDIEDRRRLKKELQHQAWGKRREAFKLQHLQAQAVQTVSRPGSGMPEDIEAWIRLLKVARDLNGMGGGFDIERIKQEIGSFFGSAPREAPGYSPFSNHGDTEAVDGLVY